jgi:hypothetical protein
MSDPLPHIVPSPPSKPDESFEVYRVTRSFYQEVGDRQAHEAYCAWYYQVAAENRRDLVKMKREADFFGWFYRK